MLARLLKPSINIVLHTTSKFAINTLLSSLEAPPLWRCFAYNSLSNKSFFMPRGKHGSTFLD